MASPDSWLEFRSKNPGMEGPYIQEYHKPYQALDRLGTTKPDIILAVGTEACTRFFETEIQGHPARQAVTLSSIALTSKQALLINCQLPTRCELSRIPDALDLGHYTLHHLERAFPNASQVSISLYIELLAPFSSVVLLFVSDFSSASRLVDFLWAWLRSAMLKPPPFCPEFVLVAEKNNQVHIGKLQSRLVTHGMKALRVSDPQHPYTEADVEKIIRTYLSLNVLSTVPDHSFPESLQSVLKSSRKKRQDAGFDFSALHWKALMRSALAQHAKQPTLPINLHQLSRIRKPVPWGIQTHITDFVESTKGWRIDQAMIIASALTMDAYPPRMHRFLPTNTFQEIYKPLIESTKAAQLVKSIEEAFVTIATRIYSNQLLSSQSHLQTIQKFQSEWLNVTSKGTCFVCISRSPRYILQCGHRLCSMCALIVQTGKQELSVQIPSCPLCCKPNSFVFVRNPATAGCRVLHLTGCSTDNTLKYLKDLQNLIGLTTFPFKNYFDEVIASDTAMFFAVAVFLEEWSLAECKYHLKTIKKPTFTKGNTLSFGNKLQWCLSNIQPKNQTLITLEGQQRIFSKFPQVTPKEFQPYIKTQPKGTYRLQTYDIFVEYDGGAYSPRLLQSISSQLISKFFYVEATSEANFYTAPEQYRFLVKCRLPPGPAVLDLFQRLHRNEAYLSYHGSEGNITKTPLITRRILDRSKALQSCSIEILVSMQSLDSLIDIQIGDIEESPQSISKCPYRLQDLIEEQGLDCPFGTEDHQREAMKHVKKRKIHVKKRQRKTDTELSLDELYRTLDQIQ